MKERTKDSKILLLKYELEKIKEHRDYARAQEVSWRNQADTDQLMIEAIYAQIRRIKEEK